MALNTGLADNNPLFQSRILAMMHTAMHDAVNAVDRRYTPYSSLALTSPGASPEAAVAAAGRAVLADQFARLVPFGFPTQQAEIFAAYTTALSAIPNGTAKSLGIAAGEEAASRILALRAGDGAYQLPIVDPAINKGRRRGSTGSRRRSHSLSRRSGAPCFRSPCRMSGARGPTPLIRLPASVTRMISTK
jgi:hypothetical protein